MVVVIFVRHGKALTNEKDILNDDIEGFPLTKEGIIATQKIAQELKKLYVLRIYSSPILRAKQTADIIGDVLEITPTTDDRLKERSFGEMYNKSAKGGDWKFDINWDKTDVETIYEVQERMASFIDSISKLKGIIIVVTHATPIKAVFMKILNFEEMMEGALSTDNSRISAISTRDEWKIIGMNYPVLDDALVESISKNL